MDGTSLAEESFIVRTWRKPGPRGATQWRGAVEHVASGERRYFRDFADLCAFIAVRQERAAQPPQRT